MKILMVNYEWPPLGGGGGVAMRDVATELSKRHEVHVLTSGAAGLPPEEELHDGALRIFRCKVWMRTAVAVASVLSMLSFYPAGVQRGRQLVRRYSYDVVNTWFAIPSGPTGVHVARYGRLPHALSIIGGDIYDPSKWYSPHGNPVLGGVVRSVLNSADRHTAISTDVAQRARELHGFQRPIDVIPLGINPPSFTPCSRDALGLEPHKKYVVSVGRLVRRKNYPALIHAVKALDRKDVELLIVGDGPEREHLKGLATSLGVGEQVQFRGFVTEEAKFQLLSNSDLFALPSLHEGFGLVYLEAMSCGLPVIASTKGGQNDFLVDGETGFLIDPDDVDGLKAAIEKLLNEPSRAIASTNKERVKEHSVARTAASYERLLEASRHRRTF
jgi:glycosyltransferase involved in cell wall biosynthesis